MAAPSPLLPAETGLVLVGYRASGKTTVGRILAERLGRAFLDADAEIERRRGMPISRIFADHGEPAFRDLEEGVLRDLCRERRGAVLATGGGAILRGANRRLLGEFGVVVWLAAPAEVLVERLQEDANRRPALTPAGLFEEVPEVLRAREPLYREVADLVVDVTAASPDDVAGAVLMMLESPDLAPKGRR